MRFVSIKVLALFVISLLIASCGYKTSENINKQKKNVLFIAVDDLRLQAGIYGQSQMITPAIDELGNDGVVFNRAYCSVPVCGASRASLLSGLRPTSKRFVNYHTWKDKDAPDVTSIPKWFKENGYTTLSRGKIYHHSDDDLEAWSEEPYIPAAGISWRSYITEESRKIIEANKNPKNPDQVKGPPFEMADVEDNAYPDGMLTDKVIEDLNQFAKSKEPFFLGVGFWKPHLPFNAPKKYWDLYSEEDIQLADNPFMPQNAPKKAKTDWYELRGMYAGIPKEGPVSDELARQLIHGYYACVSYTDAQIGKVLKELKRLGLDKNTVVVLWGDHGWHLGEHGLWCKHCNFDKVMKAPLMFKAPGMKEGKKSNTLVEFIDIYPTLCDLAGIDMPEHLDGKSLQPVLNNPSKIHKDTVFTRYHSGESVITKRYVYTEWKKKNGNKVNMLYDHSNDPDENINVADNPKYEEVVKELSLKINKNHD
ncbi:sulfatase [Marinifilum caeruleilacunae]|uniref:DUF4976 domain-containing protein n=1 Tax=Marinifilum caeruleilacunae TaxID=2499076 RepID=A0ABX1X047_9BACT|nr:sulfatase [Marinifilum caeruleilacunae]NOU61769.1 DUF4976 domain-containing protein [Marinifilum caeruleilacunae]